MLSGSVKVLMNRYWMLPRKSWKNVTFALWLAPAVLSILLLCLLLRLLQGEFQWQNSTWRQHLQLKDLEDMAFSSKDPVDQPYPQLLPHDSFAKTDSSCL